METDGLEGKDTGINKEQQEAVTAENRAVAVIAGPGTGKTKTLVDKIAYLVKERNVSPSQITAVTFTNQAAAEMRERLAKRLGGKTGCQRYDHRHLSFYLPSASETAG